MVHEHRHILSFLVKPCAAKLVIRKPARWQLIITDICALSIRGAPANKRVKYILRSNSFKSSFSAAFLLFHSSLHSSTLHTRDCAPHTLGLALVSGPNTEALEGLRRFRAPRAHRDHGRFSPDSWERKAQVSSPDPALATLLVHFAP